MKKEIIGSVEFNETRSMENGLVVSDVKVTSRSMARRKAIQGGEPIPSFEVKITEKEIALYGAESHGFGFIGTFKRDGERVLVGDGSLLYPSITYAIAEACKSLRDMMRDTKRGSRGTALVHAPGGEMAAVVSVDNPEPYPVWNAPTVAYVLPAEEIKKAAVETPSRTILLKREYGLPGDVADACIRRGVDKFWRDRIRDMVDYASTVSGTQYGDRVVSEMALVTIDPSWPVNRTDEIIVERRSDGAWFRIFNTPEQFRVEKLRRPSRRGVKS